MRRGACLGAEKERWAGDQELLQRPGIALEDSIDQCVLYCQQHPIGEGELGPGRQVPLISTRLTNAWLLHMANTHRQLAWSERYRRQRQERAEERAAAKRRAAEEARQQVRLSPICPGH